MKFLRLSLVICLSFVSLALAQSSTILNVGLDVDAGTMDPRLARDTSAARMQDLLFNGLVRLNPQLEPQPDLALSWDYTSPTKLVVELRPDVVFHDGQPFTAEDVVYTYTSLLDPEFEAPRSALYSPISDVTAVNPLTVEFTLSQPYAPLLQYLDLGIVPRGAAEELGPEFGNQPIGTGPFRLESWSKGEKIEVVANDRYFRGKPNVDGLSIRIIPDNTVRLLALESGDLDFIHSPVPPQDLERLGNSDNLVVEQTTALGYTYLNLNTQDPALSDVRVRQALAHLTDRDAISELLFYGMDQPGQSFLLPNTPFYSDDVTTYAYDPEIAAQLLDEAGWTAGADGNREKDGQPLTLELVTNVDPNRQQVLEFLQGEWATAGINVSVRVYDFAAMLADLTAGEFQVSLVGWLGLTDPDRATYLQFTTDGASNYGKYSNPEVDQLLEQGRTELDLEARQATYTQAAQIVTDELPYIFVLYQGYVVIHSSTLENYTVYPNGSWYAFESVTLNE